MAKNECFPWERLTPKDRLRLNVAKATTEIKAVKVKLVGFYNPTETEIAEYNDFNVDDEDIVI